MTFQYCVLLGNKFRAVNVLLAGLSVTRTWTLSLVAVRRWNS